VPKNKGKYKSQQETATAVEPSEAVLSFWDHLAEKLAPYRTKILVAVGLVVVVFIGLAIRSYLGRKQEEKATLGFDAAMTAANARVLGDIPADLQIPGEDPTALKFKTSQERSTATLAALDKLEADYAGTDVAKKALLVRAGVLYDLGRYDDALAAYRGSLSSASGALRYVAREGVALSIEAKALAEKDAAARTAGLDKALAEYKLLQPDEKGYYHDVAVFHQARVLALKGDKDGAVKLYKQIVDTMPSSSVVGEARERLALLEG
jgi:hypothetical protein